MVVAVRVAHKRRGVKQVAKTTEVLITVAEAEPSSALTDDLTGKCKTPDRKCPIP
jgi:hypothetical protein